MSCNNANPLLRTRDLKAGYSQKWPRGGHFLNAVTCNTSLGREEIVTTPMGKPRELPLGGLHGFVTNAARTARGFAGLLLSASWMLRGRLIVAVTASTAAIENPSGAVTVDRKNNKPALGPLGDSLDGLA